MGKRPYLRRVRLGLSLTAMLLCVAPFVEQTCRDGGILSHRSLLKRVPGFGGGHTPNPAGASHDSLSVFARDGSGESRSALLGIVPWPSAHHAKDEPTVYVGGQSIGVRLQTNGVMVIGYQRVTDEGDSPSAQAQVQIGDLIVQVDGHVVHSTDDLRHQLTVGRGDVGLKVIRHGESLTVTVHPVVRDGMRHIGLFVRDKTAGIGTFTFYDASAHRFAALGHVITDADTGQEIDGSGSLYDAAVTGMKRGVSGDPGAKRGSFGQGAVIGHIDDNSDFGIYGSMNRKPGHMLYSTPLDVAEPDEVHEGKAQLLTVLDGQRIEAFDIEIENISHQTKPAIKSMVVHVVDPDLLRRAGGIIQGMSGSPIIQNGKLVGAVTHVFLSDVTRGYGVYAAWMVEEERHPSHHHVPVETSQTLYNRCAV